MYIKKILLPLLSILSFTLHCQDLDSLYNVFRQTGPNEKTDAANAIFRTMYERGITDSIYSVSIDMPETDLQLNVLTYMDKYAKYESDYNSRIKYLTEIIEICKAKNNAVMLGINYRELAISYDFRSLTDKAIAAFENSFSIFETIGNDSLMSTTLYYMSLFYLRKTHLDKGEDYLKIAAEHAKLGNNKIIEAKCLGTLSEYYLNTGNTKEGLQKATEALDKCRAIGTNNLIENGLYWLSKAQLESKQYKASETTIKEAIALCEQMENKEQLAFDYMFLGDIYKTQNAIAPADEYFTKSLSLYEEIGNLTGQSLLNDRLYMLYRKSNPRLALQYFERCETIDDSISSLEIEQQVNEFHVKYDTQQKEYQIKLQEEEIHRKNALQIVLLCGITICCIIIYIVYRYRQLDRRRNKELTETNTIKDKFFSIISHDLKNPAFAQRNVLKMMNENFENLDSSTIKSCLHELLKSADSQVDLLLSLFEWAQMETGRMTYNPSNFELKNLIIDTKSLVNTQLSEKNITLNILLPQEDNLIVCGDRNMISTVLRNLLTNAIKFSYKGSEINLSVTAEGTNKWRISIEDHGTGIPADKLPTLFNLGQRHSQVGTSGEKGSGLGLIVCREMVERNGGTITVESTVGKGSTFSFDVPTG